MKLSGQTAVVTGASRGIGRSLAFALAAEGCNLLLTALEKDELEAVGAAVAAAHSVAVASRPCDLTDPGERQAFVDWLAASKNPPDILVNNAGSGWFGPFAGSAWESIERTLALDVAAPTYLMHAVLPTLRLRPQAMIVNISSAVGRLPYPGLAVYGAAKGYVSSLSDSLQCELAPSHVHVLCFHPGFTDTSFISSAGMDLSRVPRRMISRPDDVARRIAQAMKRNRTWEYGDAAGRFGVALAAALPHRVRARLFRNLFWELPRP